LSFLGKSFGLVKCCRCGRPLILQTQSRVLPLSPFHARLQPRPPLFLTPSLLFTIQRHRILRRLFPPGFLEAEVPPPPPPSTLFRDLFCTVSYFPLLVRKRISLTLLRLSSPQHLIISSALVGRLKPPPLIGAINASVFTTIAASLLSSLVFFFPFTKPPCSTLS